MTITRLKRWIPKNCRCSDNRSGIRSNRHDWIRTWACCAGIRITMSTSAPPLRTAPAHFADMASADFTHLLEDIDGYLCELGAAQIRDGLHILGEIPAGDPLIDLICAITRLS